MSKTIIVSASNDGYLIYLEEMLSSLGTRLADHDLGIIDLGLTDSGKSKIKAHKPDVSFAVGKWRLNFPCVDKTPEYKKVFASKPFLPEMFPGYDGYIWVDADIWFPDATAIDDYMCAAERTGAAFSFEAHPTYCASDKIRRVRVFNFTIIKGIKNYYVKQVRSMFGSDIAAKYGVQPGLNSGIFYIASTSPVWQAWQRQFLSADLSRQHRESQICDQTILQVALIRHDLAYTAMSTTYNWIPMRSAPLMNAETFTLSDPAYPHDPIKVIHLVGISKEAGFEVVLSDGRRIQTAGRWSNFMRRSEDVADR